jgi:uncharacterized protein (TIRG00374 family)
MAGRSRRALILGFSGAVVLLVGLFVLVGAGAVVDVLVTAEGEFVAATLLLALAWLVAWGLMLRAALGALDIEITLWLSFFIYNGVVFANNVTPFGQAGGEPIAALLVSKVTNSRYESSLAGVASVDLCNVVASLTLVFLGVSYQATTATIAQRVETAVGSAVFLIGAVTVLLFVLWRYRDRLAQRVPGVVSPPLVRAVPRLSSVPNFESALTDRLEGLIESFELLTTDHRTLSLVLSLSVLGWVFQAAALMTAFAAFGQTIPVAVALFTIPLANLAGAAPLPGGLGGIEAAFVALLVPTTGVPAATITAAVLLFRGAIYWLPVVIGGVTTAALGVRTIA